jgi:hypothetical protein
VEPSLYVPVALNCCVAPTAILGLAGEIAIDFSVAVETVIVAVALTPFNEAVTVVEPPATPVATPLELMVATAVSAMDHVACELTFPVEPSLYVPVAVNCCVVPTDTVAVAGVIAIDFSVAVAAGTVSVAVPLKPLAEAVTVVDPAATAVAIPPELTVATAVLELVHVAVAVTSAVELSLYVAVALNCCVFPAATLEVEGETVTPVIVFVRPVVPPLPADTELPQPVPAIMSESEARTNDN